MTENVVVSDHIERESLLKLFAEYVEPFRHLEAVKERVSPRRILGNYLTYLVVDGQDTHSVMIKKNKTEINVHCDCKEFTNYHKCPHVARVIVSMDLQIKDELLSKVDTKRQEEEKKLLEEEKRKVDAYRREQETKAKILVNQNQKKDTIQYLRNNILEVAPKGNKNLPYLIKNARDFSLYRLNALIPALRNVSRRGKEFIKISGPKKGFDVQYKNNKIKHIVSFRVNEDDDLEVTCDCGYCYENNPCTHAIDTIFYQADMSSFGQFIPYTNQDKEKNRLLDDYGLTVSDPEAQHFTFSSDYAGRIVLTKIPPQYINLQKLLKIKDTVSSGRNEVKPNKYLDTSHDIGIYIQLSNDESTNIPVRIEAFKIEKSKKGEDKYTKILIGKEENLRPLSVLDDEKYNILMDFSYLRYKDFVTSGFYTQSYTSFTTQLFEAGRKQYLQHFFNKLEEHWSSISKWDNFKILPEGENFSKSNLLTIEMAEEPLYADLKVDYSEKFITINALFKDIDNKIVVTTEDEKKIFHGRLISSRNKLYINNNHKLADFLNSMPYGELKIPTKYQNKLLKELLYPLSVHFGIALPEALSILVKEFEMSPAVHLREFEEKFLIIEPKFHYGDYELGVLENEDYFIEEDDQKYILIRDKNEETIFVEYLKSMHNLFKAQNYLPYFTIPFDDVMKNNWFLNFSRDLMSKGIKMIGFNDLKKFKYNTTTPKWDMSISSGIDWFDVKITASWGDQEISFRDIKKAIVSGQNFVILGDGSFGMLPEEWLEKYANLFKFGVDDKEGLKINKKQFNIIEVLFDQIDNEEVLAEINEKKQKLLNIDKIKMEEIPSTINATLRPYQVTGYQWMQVLDEISWGGCLADDMGLGKTLQAITFLAYVKQKYGNVTSLIICPTSLIFNWESEFQKFAPSLNFHIFYGLDRTFDDDHFNEYDIIITSYGIVRNDIERLMKFDWEYVILDESQAIKNPDAISTKAVQLLKSRNKFILSGTPLQNNTYDIYAQFNFLNPGMLGAREFFRQEFANPIDKNGDKDAGMMLRKMITPFILRRTKSEVAPDLPEKTESVLWCQMDKAQKTMYDEYKDYYRHALMQKIEKEGMGKAGMYILEGLLRLRQICDDPRLIKDTDIKPAKGIKIKELMREIEENMGNHKMLVFSQFTEMLSLIKDEFEASKIKYSYLDGSTPAHERKNQVETFQSDKSINVFLISLKAGGVGLNLTEADYVYLVDPWWNPAVEQQAIDRTHRIGQKNKIFAYKMICKDSVEEKIMVLQEKKLAISKEIIQEDTAFFKSLSKDDINFLFS
jgi:SNF2 family DNA or RNA helicase